MEFIEVLKKKASEREECKSCPLYGQTPLFYEKNYPGLDRCDILFFGLSPKKQEVSSDRPFISPSGQFIREKLSEFGLMDFRIVFTNAILCSLPTEKDIEQNKKCIDHCTGLARETIKYLLPRFFVAIGKSCTTDFFGIRGRMINISGKFFGTNNNIMPLIHPSSIISSTNPEEVEVNMEIFKRSLLNLKERVTEGRK